MIMFINIKINNFMKYSIVIPAFKRSDLITKCLESIERQIVRPLEVIIVDNNYEAKESKKLKRLVDKFLSKSLINIVLKKSPKNSGAIARNIGAKSSKGEIVAFLDSDVILDDDYYSILLEYFSSKKDLIAIQGIDKALIETQSKLLKKSLLNKIIYHFEQFFETSLLLNRKTAYVSPSLAVAHPSLDDDFEIPSQWISTCAGLFKRNLFDNYSFPNQFVTYSNNEYLIFSYSLFLNEEGLMLYTNKAKYRDIQTQEGRISRKSLIYQVQAYDLYIFLKLFRINPLNLFIFIKSRIGHLIYNIARLIIRKNFSLKDYFHAVFSIIYPLLNFNSIKKGNLDFYEKKFLFKK